MDRNTFIGIVTIATLFAHTSVSFAMDAGVPESDGGIEGEVILDEPSLEDGEYVYETEVVGYRLHRTDEVTGFAETIEIGDKRKSMDSVTDVVSQIAGVDVRNTGGPGSFGAAVIRGSTPNQVPVYLDGVLLNFGGFSVVNLGDFSLDILDSIEVYRGNTPLALGIGGIGGAVVLLTRDYTSPVTEVAASYGAWNTWRLTAMRQNMLGSVRALVLFAAGGSNGDFKYFNTNGTPNNPDDDEYVRRSNNHHTSYSGLVKLNANFGKWEGQLTDDLFLIRQGVTGLDSFVDVSSAELRRMRNSISLRGKRALSRRTEMILEISNLLMKEDFADPEGVIGIGQRRVSYQSLGLGGSAFLNGTLSEAHRLSTRASFMYENYLQNNPGLPEEEQPNPIYRVKPGLGVEYEWNLRDKFYTVPSVRGEFHHSYFGGGPTPELLDDVEATTVNDFYVSPSLGIRYLISDVFTLRANGGRYVRTPELTELFGNHGQIVGNPDLEEEVGYNFDAGLTSIASNLHELDLLRLDAVFFLNRVSNLITMEQNSQSTLRPVNVEKADIWGLEFSARITAFGILGFSGNYTYFNGVNKSDIPQYEDKLLPGRSPHKVYARFNLKREFAPIGLEGWYDLDYSSRAYAGQYNTEAQVSMHLFHGVGGRIEIVSWGLSFTLEVDNLTDNRTFNNLDGDTLPMSDYLRYPLPGRAVFATIFWKVP